MSFNKNHSLQVCIKPVENQEGDFLALYQTSILQSTFFLYFKDNIMGSIALNTFTGMLGKRYNTTIELCLLDDQARFQNKALLDILTQNMLLSKLKK